MVTRINVLDIPVEDFHKYNKALELMKNSQNSTSFANISQYHGAPFFCNYNQWVPLVKKNSHCIFTPGLDRQEKAMTPMGAVWTTGSKTTGWTSSHRGTASSPSRWRCPWRLPRHPLASHFPCPTGIGNKWYFRSCIPFFHFEKA